LWILLSLYFCFLRVTYLYSKVHITFKIDLFVVSEVNYGLDTGFLVSSTLTLMG
jgi:hypothetical protein